MLAILPALKLRLQEIPVLGAWDVRTNLDADDRRVLPAVDVRCSGAQVLDSESRAVTLDPAYSVYLVVRRGSSAAFDLDAAMQAVVASLHNWRPGAIAGQQWRRVALRTVREPEFVDSGQAGYELVFTSSAVYHGAPA